MLERVQTTTLAEIRDFLRAEGCAPPPWSAPERSVDALYRLLQARRGDDRFWAELKDLARRLEDRRFNAEALAALEVLPEAKVDGLLDDLRSSLDGDAGRPPSPGRLGTAMRATALAAFLLLGVAAGCKEEEEGDAATDADGDSDADADDDGDTGDADGDGEAGPLCDEAVAEGLAGAEGQVYCDLVDVIEGSTLESDYKDWLYDCLPELDAAYRATMLGQVQDMTAEQLLAFLSGLMDPGQVCEMDAH